MDMSESMVALPSQAISEEVLLEKYAKDGDRNIDDVRRRVAKALAAVETPSSRAEWEARFYWAQLEGFIPGGRINSAAGTDLKANFRLPDLCGARLIAVSSESHLSSTR